MKRIINEYIEYTKKSIRQYMNIIFDDRVDSEVMNEFIITYINVRYYNIYDKSNEKKSFYVRITNELEKKYKVISEKYRTTAQKNKVTIDLRKSKEKIMAATKEVFELLVYWDNVVDIENVKKNKTLNTSINAVEIIRKKYYNIESSDEFREKLLNKIRDDLIKKDLYLDNLESDLFKIKLTKNPKKSNLYYVDLIQEINFPMVYSSRIIDKVFKEDVIAEEALKVQFTLISSIIIRDIVNGKFKDVYILSLPDNLIKKKTKMENTFSNINTQILQDKIYLKIYYSDFVKNKGMVYKFISAGYKFVIEIDKTFNDMDELEHLKIFKYILLNNKLKVSEEVQKYKDKYDNILEK